MAMTYEQLEKEVRTLSPEEKAALARTLIDDLESETEQNVEAIWAEEAERRYRAFLAGELEAIPGDEVMTRARQRVE